MARIDEGLFEAWAVSENLLQEAVRQIRGGASLSALNELAELKLEANQRFMALWNAGATQPLAPRQSLH